MAQLASRREIEASDRCWSLLDRVEEPCACVDREFHLLYCNAGFAAAVAIPRVKLLGGALPTTLSWFLGSPCHRACVRAVQSETPQEVEQQIAERHFLTRIFPRPEGLDLVFVDTAEQRKAQDESKRLREQLYHAEKLNGLGLLASGIAHDFNNMLVGIVGAADLLLRDPGSESHQRELVEVIRSAGARATQLARQVLTYAGKGSNQQGPVQLNDLVRECLPLVAVSLSKQNGIASELEPNLPPIQGSAIQMQQVVMNLVLNAAEASRGRAGPILVRTQVREAGRPTGTGNGVHNVIASRAVCLEVRDRGCGMTPELQARIFDPFFSTKGASRGLGLSVVRDIVRAHHGTIEVVSKPEEGTSFLLSFPC